MPVDVEQLYGEIWGREDAAFQAALAQSSGPRAPELLYDMFGALGVAPGELAIDVGCRDARDAVAIARRFGRRVLGIDPVALHIERARTLVARAGLTGQVRFERAMSEALPVSDGSALSARSSR